jgi:predicted TIM-barrel fold metal-dependent hydrolase
MDEPVFPPPGSCDCHVHVIGPKDRFPLARERTYTPKDATQGELAAMLARLGLERVVLVQPSIYGTDNACMLDTLDALAGRARAVAVVAPDVAGSELDELHRRGVRGLRVNVASIAADTLEAVRMRLGTAAALCARNGWHVQTFLPAAAVAPLAGTLAELAVPVVIDHFGLVGPADIDSEAAAQLVRLLQTGRLWVKLSAPYRIADDPADLRIGPLARKLAGANPERVVWGSDWPHTPAHGHHTVVDDAELPYRDLDTKALLGLVQTWFAGDARAIARVLVHNPAALYGF